MSALEEGGGRPKFKVNSELSYQNKTCSGCQQDVRKTEKQKDFSAYLSKQKLFRMSTGCQKDRKTEIQTDRQTD